MSNIDYHREPATITLVRAVNFREGNHVDPNTVEVWLEFGGGGACMFGGLALTEKHEIAAFISMLMAVFGVTRQEDLVGKKCIALRPFGGFQDPVEGLESVDTGRRFTFTSFRKALGFPAPSPLEERTKSLRDELVRTEARIKSLKEQIKHVGDRYVAFD